MNFGSHRAISTKSLLMFKDLTSIMAVYPNSELRL